MSEANSLFSGLLVIALLVGLLLFIIRGGRFRTPSAKGIGRPSGGGGLFGTGKTRTANRTPVEVFFALFAVANLATSESASKLGAPILVTAMVLLVISYAAFSDLGLLVVIFGAVAAFTDIALTKGTGVAFAVLVITAFLAWIYYGMSGGASRS